MSDAQCEVALHVSAAGHTITFSRASDRVGVILALICVDCDKGLWSELQRDLDR